MKTKIQFVSKTYSMQKPTRIIASISKTYKIRPVRHVENSLDAAVKLAKMNINDSVFVTQKQKQHFYTAAKLHGFKVLTRQGIKNTNKVRIWKTA